LRSVLRGYRLISRKNPEVENRGSAKSIERYGDRASLSGEGGNCCERKQPSKLPQNCILRHRTFFSVLLLVAEA
jgi:hypothetical protein